MPHRVAHARTAAMLALAGLALATAGCTSMGATSATSSAHPRESSSPTPTTSPQISVEITSSEPSLSSNGEFVSQAVATAGSATLDENSDHSIFLSFDDFSTADRPDIRLYLNTDPVILGSDGFYKVIESPTSAGQFEAGHLTSATGDQTYDLTFARQQLRSTRSITLYDYSAREALGSVNIGPIG